MNCRDFDESKEKFDDVGDVNRESTENDKSTISEAVIAACVESAAEVVNVAVDNIHASNTCHPAAGQVTCHMSQQCYTESHCGQVNKIVWVKYFLIYFNYFHTEEDPKRLLWTEIHTFDGMYQCIS